MILVGVDPGNVTGIAVWWDPRAFDTTTRDDVDVDTAEVEADHVAAVLRRMLDGHRPRACAVERFRQNARRSHQPAAYHVTGAVKALCAELGVSCVQQSPGTAKKFGATKTLKKLGWWTPTKDGHANAAIGNLLLLMATVTPERYAELIGI